MEEIKLKINGKEIVCSSEQTVMQVARDNGIDIPGLCGHPDFPVKANCRICLVEIVGQKRLVPSCHVKVENGMEIKTDTERVKKARNLNIELIFAEHIEKCANCIWRVNCQLLDLAKKYKIKITHFKDRKSKRKIYKFANAVEIDGTQCIDCRNCLDACNLMQKINYLELKGKGANQEIVPVIKKANLFCANQKNKKVDCIYCGQCTVHCPVGAAQEQSHWEAVEEVIKSREKIVVAQFSPSVLVSIGEEFNSPYDKISANQIVAGLRQLGFAYVFDINSGVNATVVAGANELIKRIIKKEKLLKVELPMLTSCCPAWVKYVEFYLPKFIPNLTIARSPHINNGGIIKTHLEKQFKINPKKIIVVSIAPCTAKKFEATRLELKINNNLSVDYVLTTRELAWLFKKNNINLGELKDSFVDNIDKNHNSSSAICETSGGVTELILRATQDLLCVDKKNINSNFIYPDFEKAGISKGIIEAEIKIADKILRVAIVNGIGNIGLILDKMLDYDFIEVKACPDGCIGGGGQPIPTTQKIRQKRIEALNKN